MVNHIADDREQGIAFLPRFDAEGLLTAIAVDSVSREVLMLAFVYLVGVLYVWPRYIALDMETWYATPTGGARRLALAGWWFVYVSLPLFQFMLFRWYFRLFIWIRFLWQVTRCQLTLVPTHPDGSGGLGFLANIVVAFLHGLVPIILVSIADDLAAVILAIVAIVWAIILLIGSIPAVVKSIRVSIGG